MKQLKKHELYEHDSSIKKTEKELEDIGLKLKKTRGNNYCNEKCTKSYCSMCYMNGERLFCLEGHGTASREMGRLAYLLLSAQSL